MHQISASGQNLDEKQIADAIINDLKKHSIVSEYQNQYVTVIYNTESNDVLYTVSEVAELIKTNSGYVYGLINKGLLPALKLGSLKRRSSLLEFLERYEGYDLTNPNDVKPIEHQPD